MPTFHPPVYSKHTDAQKGSIESCYTFAIDFKKEEQPLTFIANEVSDITVASLQSAIGQQYNWWTTFLNQFMQASAKLFAKSYTVEQINKITKHLLCDTSSSTFPATILLLPHTIQIKSGIFWVKWNYICEPIMIDIPALPDTPVADTSILISSILPDLSNDTSIVNDVEEFNLDEVPMDKNATDNHFEIENSNQFYDKQKVKEARLKAKLALYKAQSKMRMYYDKYGNEISDSDSEEDSEESEDEVQL